MLVDQNASNISWFLQSAPKDYSLNLLKVLFTQKWSLGSGKIFLFCCGAKIPEVSLSRVSWWLTNEIISWTYSVKHLSQRSVTCWPEDGFGWAQVLWGNSKIVGPRTISRTCILVGPEHFEHWIVGPWSFHHLLVGPKLLTSNLQQIFSEIEPWIHPNSCLEPTKIVDIKNRVFQSRPLLTKRNSLSLNLLYLKDVLVTPCE